MELDREELQELREEQDEANGNNPRGGSSPEGKGVTGVLAFIRLGLDIQSTQYVVFLSNDIQLILPKASHQEHEKGTTKG